jgi:hypothetical protein
MVNCKESEMYRLALVGVQYCILDGGTMKNHKQTLDRQFEPRPNSKY